MKHKHIVLLASSLSVFTGLSALGQFQPPAVPPAARPDNPEAAALEPGFPPAVTRTVVPSPITRDPASRLQSFEFAGADLDTVMTMYCEWTDKIYMKNDAVNATISLKADKLSIPECIEAVEAVLGLNNIIIVPSGDKFVKVLPANAADITGQGGAVSWSTETDYEGTDRVVSQIIPLKNVQIQDVQTAIQHLMHSYGKIQTLEASNSLLITDTEANILRIRDLVEFVDKASARIEPRFFEIIYADATEIASTLNEIVVMAQSDQSSSSGAAIPTPAGIIRARGRQAALQQAPTAQATITTAAGGDRMMIQGNVKIMPDERTNLILIFSQEENFEFFERIIKMLDVEVEPAITFEVVNLEYADAEELSGTLNDLVGAAQGSRTSSTTGGNTSSSRSSSSTANRTGAPTGGMNTRVAPNAEPSQAASLENLSQLSENTKILSDSRSNSILLMGRKSDIAAIKSVIASLDVMLEQVIIEAAIFEIGLNQGLNHGIEWLYRSQDGNRIGAWDGADLVTNSIANVAAGALTYYQNITGINTELAINMAASDSNARVLATPVIMTTDNTEAQLSIGEQRPVVTSTDSSLNSTQLRSSYEYRDIGIQLTVTPRINPQRFVVMEISQQADQLGGTVQIDNNDVPIILNRQFDASIAVPDRGTIALGGLMTTEFDDSVTKIPILGDIPLIGRYLFSSVRKTEVRRELLVLMTPYVMTNNQELTKETERIYKRTALAPEDWTWSDSKLQYIPAESN